MHIWDQVLKRQFLIFQYLSPFPSGLSLQYDQNTYSDCEDGHERTESRKTEIQQLHQPLYDEPDTQQEHAKILR
jgi:hypothetical protein